MRFFLALLTLGFFFFANPRSSYAYSGACAGPQWELDQVLTRILNEVPGAVYKELTDDQRMEFLGGFNATSPPTGFMFDRIGYFSVAGSPMVLTIMGMGDCAWQIQPVPLPLFRAWLGNERA